MSGKKATTAVFFTTDYGFLIPTVAAALQVSKQIQHDSDTDILIFLVDFLAPELAELNVEFEQCGIHFIDMQSSAYDKPDSYYYKSHIPKSALARLCVGEMIPTQYENLIYLDGDIQIVGDISKLLKWKVQPGYILAGLDQGLLELGEPGSSVSGFYRRYTGALGVRHPLEYFNSGVMAFQRSTLAGEGPAALQYYEKNSEKCIQHDQSALNAVFGDRREYLSPRYNFMPRFYAIGAASFMHPAIIHFADKNKPWHEPVKPWLAKYATVYADVKRDHKVLEKFDQHLRKQPTASPYRPNLLKSILVALAFPIRRLARRRKLRTYLATTLFAFE